MIGFDFKQFRQFFFDRAAVIRAMDKSTRRALSKAGAFVMKRARTSMKYRMGPSPAGSPPHAHKTKKGKTGRGPLLRKFLFFGYEPAKQSVVIGPTALPGKRPEAPGLNEFGGTASRSQPVRVAVRRATPAQARAFRRKLLSGQIIRQKVPRKQVQARYPRRSYMGPALREEVAAGTIPNQWANSVRRG